MDLVRAQAARSIWLFDIRDLNPRGKDILSDLVAWLKDNYAFSQAPDPDTPPPNLQAQGGLRFERGRFQTEEEIFIEIAGLTIYNDGIVVDAASSTEDGDRFAVELLRSAASEFKLSFEDGMVRKKRYLSELIVRSVLDLSALNPALAVFAKKLSAALSEKFEIGVGGLAFWSAANDAGQHRMFRIERQLGRAFPEQRFYSQAPLQTKVHLGLLEELERLLAQ